MGDKDFFWAPELYVAESGVLNLMSVSENRLYDAL